ncbi:MAG: DUF3545 family protein [Gammaproteobacteria bacterium]|nr:DUF3545 family protein [Gammaproteobacteria bacterium]
MSGIQDKTRGLSIADDDEMDDNMDHDTIDDFEQGENAQLISVRTKNPKTSHWRLVEEAKEQLRLKKELADYDNYLD